MNSLVIQDASYIRLKNVQLSYQVPVKSKHIKSLKFYATGSNLMTWTNYIGFDPEANSYGNSNIRIDYSSYPMAKSYIFGMNVGF